LRKGGKVRGPGWRVRGLSGIALASGGDEEERGKPPGKWLTPRAIAMLEERALVRLFTK
jgi:hypothetical protein